MAKKFSLFLLILAIQSDCFAMAPDYGGVGALIQIVLGIGLLWFVAAGAIMAEDNRFLGGIVGAGVYALVIVSAFLYFKHEGDKRDEAIREATAWRLEVNKKRTDATLAHLTKLCDAEEKFVVNKKIPLGSSIFVNLFPEAKPPTADHSGWNHQQYGKLISWVEDADQPKIIAKLVQTDLIDMRDRHRIRGKPFTRLATKQRWEKDGLSDIAIAYTGKRIDEYKFKNWPESKLVDEIPIDESNAQYIFTVEDISTKMDREVWVARGRIRLTDAVSGEVVSEYVGFEAILPSGVGVCPDVAKLPKTRSEKMDILGFFFGTAVENIEVKK